MKLPRHLAPGRLLACLAVALACPADLRAAGPKQARHHRYPAGGDLRGDDGESAAIR